MFYVLFLAGISFSFVYALLAKRSSHHNPPTDPESHSDSFPAARGQHLNGFYYVHLKLGAGVYSTTWLVSDTRGRNGRPTKFYAAKILTGEATRQHLQGVMLEAESLRRVAECEDINCLPVLRNQLMLRTKSGRPHLCFVVDLLGPNLATLRLRVDNKALPYYTVRNVLAQVLEGLVQLHDLNVVHTDIKPDNILLTNNMSDEKIEQWLRDVPDDEKAHPVPDSFDPGCTAHAAELVSVVLADLGQSQRAGQQPTVGQFSAMSLRAPECILRSDFGPKVDIWAIGCIAFELLTGRWLFHPEDGGEDWTLEDDHLAKMMELTNERFSEAMLQRAGLHGDKFFDTGGNLRRIPELCPVSIEEALANYNTLPIEEIRPAAEFIRYCCRLDSTDRPTARQVELHPWLGRAYEC